MCGNLAFQEDVWEEMIDGRIIAMSPRPAVNHNRVSGNIHHIFSAYLKGKPCEAFGDGVDLYLADKEQYVPDGMIVCDNNKIRPNGVYGAPDLVIEVLSPSTAKYDRGHKKDVYAAAGIPEYWIADPANKTVEVYALSAGNYVLHDAYSLLPDYMLEKMKAEERAALVTEFKCRLFDDLTIRLEDVFDRVH